PLPEATSFPEATATPETTAAPEATDTPAATPAPTETQAPEPSPTAPTAEPTETTTAQQGGSACTDIAAFYGDLTVPDDTVYYQQTDFTKGWELRNNGTCTWDAGYRLVFNSGDPLGAPLTNPLPGQIEPGQTVNLYLDMRAPDGGGTYYSNWELQNGDGQRFGVGINGTDYFWARIKVTFLAPGESGTQPPGGAMSGGGTSQTAGNCAFTTNPGYVQDAITLINQARAGNGLPPLAENAALDAAAQAHSQDMACNNLISHTGSDGSSWGDRIRAQGYDYARALENIYAGDPSGGAQDAVDWWLNSAVHYANIMDPDVTEIGVGFAASDNALYNGRFTADFAAP
ncbi:MAG: NBR1-Ig-like domain-containing protein, partial [Anaerolineales bacterium]